MLEANLNFPYILCYSYTQIKQDGIFFYHLLVRIPFDNNCKVQTFKTPSLHPTSSNLWRIPIVNSSQCCSLNTVFVWHMVGTGCDPLNVCCTPTSGHISLNFFRLFYSYFSMSHVLNWAHLSPFRTVPWFTTHLDSLNLQGEITPSFVGFGKS